MKLKTITVLSLLVVAANGATTTSLANLSGARSYPIVDNTGSPLTQANSSLQFGTFTDAFAATLASLSTDEDQAVIDAFTPSGGTFSFSFDGVFNASGDTDSTGQLGDAASDNGAYAMVTYTGGATPEVLVFSFGGPFPQQVDGDAVLALGRLAEVGDVVFGGDTLIPLTSQGNLPDGLYANGDMGIPLNAIPEPSTGLLGLIAGLGLLARRRR